MTAPFRVPRAQRFRFGPFVGMQTALEETASPKKAFAYAENMYPLDPDKGGAWVLRPPVVSTSGLPGTEVKCFHSFVLSSGNTLNVAIVNNEIWKWLDGSTWTKADTLPTSTIPVDPNAVTYYTLTFAGVMVISDGVNPPFTWDGGLGGGFVQLSNCPALHGQPTEYAGKLFGIKANDRRTMVWSEENDPTTGYEAGGFNNAWTLSQSGDEPLNRLLGRNDGLYYWRPSSVGRIQGAVNADFRTTHTHDALNVPSGTVDPGSVVDAGDGLWWYGTDERVYVHAGGETVDVSPSFTASKAERLVSGTTSRWLRATHGDVRTTLSGSGSGVETLLSARAALVGPNAVTPRRQVWFALPAYYTHSLLGELESPESILLVYDAVRRVPVAWYVYPTGTTIGGSSGLVGHLTAFNSYQVASPGLVAVTSFPTGGAAIWHLTLSPALTGDFGSGSNPVTGRLVGPVAGGSDDLEVTWTQCDAVLRLPARPDGAQIATVELTPVTSAHAFPDALSLVPAPSTTTATTQRATFGVEQVGRWLQPDFTLVWRGGEQGYGLVSYTVQATAANEDPDAL